MPHCNRTRIVTSRDHVDEQFYRIVTCTAKTKSTTRSPDIYVSICLGSFLKQTYVGDFALYWRPHTTDVRLRDHIMRIQLPRILGWRKTTETPPNTAESVCMRICTSTGSSLQLQTYAGPKHELAEQSAAQCDRNARTLLDIRQ